MKERCEKTLQKHVLIEYTEDISQKRDKKTKSKWKKEK